MKTPQPLPVSPPVPFPSRFASSSSMGAEQSVKEPRTQQVDLLHLSLVAGICDIQGISMFQEECDREARSLLCNLLKEASNPVHWKYASNDSNSVPSRNRKAHALISKRWKRTWRKIRIQQRPMANTWYLDMSKDRFLYAKTGSKSFVVFMSDFILGFDELTNLLALACPLSRTVVQSLEHLSMDQLLDDVPEPQVHFIARRLSQLTGISWNFDCLAKFEQKLPGANRLEKFTDILEGSFIDIGASSLGILVGCSVGLIPGGEDVSYVYQVGLNMFDTVFGLSTSKSAIRYPESLESPSFVRRDEITDFLNMSIGGVHNLCFIPKNEDFKRIKGRFYTNPKIIYSQFMRLGYGSQMAEALRERAAYLLLDSKYVTVQWTLDSLIQTWRDVSDRSMIPLTFRNRIQATRVHKEGDTFLVLHSGELIIAKSRKNILKNMTVGLNTGVVNGSVGISMTKGEIQTQSTVKSIFDAVSHLHGSQPNFSKEGDNWYKPNPPGMSEITGALAFLSVMLAGKVKSSGKFMSAVPDPKFPEEVKNEELQSVRFDIPIPYGVVYSTFARDCEPQNADAPSPGRDFCTIGVEHWNPRRNYDYPVIVGGPRNDDKVRRAIFSV